MKRTWSFAAMLLIVIPCCGLFGSCSSPSFRCQTDPEIRELLESRPAYPSVRFAVIADTHYYDAGLGTSGKAFREMLGQDRKLLKESAEIMETLVAAISRETADFVLVCGDLTKDGERINHERMRVALDAIEASGKKVFVVPGNHDVANGNAVRYGEKGTEPVPGVTGEQFAGIYRNFGYAEAISRDPDSLGYVVEPVDGLWLLALDSCRWKENEPGKRPLTAGAFSPATLVWIEEMLIRAKRESRAVIGFLHHGVLEHYPGNEKYFARYIVEDYRRISKLLAGYGVGLVFSGHFHAQDITVGYFQDPKSFLFDIETGSPVSHPCPYRLVEITAGQKAMIASRMIRSLPSRSEDFDDYAKNFVYTSTMNIADRAVKKYWISEEDRQLITPAIAGAYVAHLEGDEKLPDILLDADRLGNWSRFVFWMRKDLLIGWYSDLPPGDNTVTIDLKTGQYRPE